MAAKKKVGDLIKEARTGAGLTQEQLAKQVENVSASDISKAERGEKELTQTALKQIAKATGVTQKSLLEAASGSSAAKTGTAKASSSKTSSSKTGSGKTSSAKTSTAKTSTAKTSASKTGAAKKTTSSGTSVKLTAAEKKFVELYRKANADQRKAAEAALKGEEEEKEGGLVETLLSGAVNLLGNIGG